jgi:competence ComEA-like helix-hairpin-helix protein
MADSALHHPNSAREAFAPRNSAGPYGFTRTELVALSVLGCVLVAISIGHWLAKRSAADLPAWRLEKIFVDSREQPPNVTSTPSATQTDTNNRNRTLLDLNAAPLEDLLRLPGIGPVLAARIIDNRKLHGPFNNLVDLQRVRGIGPKKAAALTGLVGFSAQIRIPGDSARAEP